MKTFTKNDLKTGDFVILRNGLAGVVVAEKGAIIYQSCGYDEIDCMFNDDLTSLDGDDLFDIVRVYRAPWDGVISFSDFSDEGEIVFESPTANEQLKTQSNAEKYKNKQEHRKHNLVSVMTQAFYGNRVITKIEADNGLLGLEALINGTSFDFYKSHRNENFKLKLIPLSDNVAIAYNENAEIEMQKNRCLEKYKPLCTISDKDITLYTRCVLCRFKNESEIESLRDGDTSLVKNYFAL